MQRIKLIAILSFFIGSFQAISQTPINVKVDAGNALFEVQPDMWGLFFEDINFAADGGLYAELVKNRSFEFYIPLMGWKEIKVEGGKGSHLVINQQDNNPSNPRYLQLTSDSNVGWYGLANEGFRGMGVKAGEQYNFTVVAQLPKQEPLALKVQLVSRFGNILGEAVLTGFANDWQQQTAILKCDSTDAKAKLNVMIQGPGSINLDMISLFPKNTWKNRPNGMRADLVQLLADMKPGFLRFPGGCIVEGHELDTRYQWKKTVGPLNDRELIVNRWNTTFPRRSAPDYFQSFGLGFYEYFLLCEDIGAEPLPILNCGMACQYQTGEVVPLDDLEPYIDDMLDLIEFANGETNTEWGRIRAEMGHPVPFNLKYLGIGNEQWGSQYVERYKVISERIREKYPQMKLVSGSGPSPDGAGFNYLWSEMKNLKTDLVDEHYYKDPKWFLSNASRYDNYDRSGPKVFAGEYACHAKEDKQSESRNTWLSAMCEAAFMTGLERNADVVQLASYAPLFAHVDAWQWRPDMIWFDNLKAVATPNYYVQKLYSTNNGTHVVSMLCDGQILAGKDSLYASATIDRKNGKVIMKLVNASTKSTQINIAIDGVKGCKKEAIIQKMSSPDLYTFNTIEKPDAIIPQQTTIAVIKNNVNIKVEPQSFIVVTVFCNKL